WVESANNTPVSWRSVHHYVDDAGKGRRDEPAAAAFKVRASGKVCDSYGDAAYGFSIDNERRPHTGEELQAWYRKSLSWEQQSNVYAEGKGLFIVGSKSVAAVSTIKDVGAWNGVLGLEDTGSPPR